MADFLVVVRSGSTDYDLQGRIRGNLPIPLSPAGLLEAEEAARALARNPPVALYTSPALSAVQTAATIGSALPIAPRTVDGLADPDFGLWKGMLVTEIRRRQPRLARHWDEDPWTVVPPDGEPLSCVRARVAAALGRLRAKHASGRVAVVVPSPLDRIIRHALAGVPVGDLWSIPPAGAAVFEIPLPASAAFPPAPPRVAGWPMPRLGGLLPGVPAGALSWRGRLGVAES
jgi:probable phosphoglycerate mutase